MTRQLSATLKTKLNNTSNATNDIIEGPVVLGELVFDSGITRFCNAPFDITWQNNIYLGIDRFAHLEPVEEGTEMKSYQIRAVLSGIRSDIAALALNEPYLNRPAKFYIAFLRDNEILPDPVLIFQGRMDQMDIDLGEKSSVQLTVSDALADWERARIRRFTHQDQIAVAPDDKFFEFVPATADKELIWGRS